MANSKVENYLMPTEFKDLASGHTSFGFRFFSDDVAYYDNTWTSMPNTPEEVWCKVCEDSEAAVQDFIDDILENNERVIIGSKIYSSDELLAIVSNNVSNKQ